MRTVPASAPVDARQDLQQRALAGAVAPDDPEELAPVDVEGDVSQSLQLAVLHPCEGVGGALLERVDRCSGIRKRLSTPRTSITTGASVATERPGVGGWSTGDRAVHFRMGPPPAPPGDRANIPSLSRPRDVGFARCSLRRSRAARVTRFAVGSTSDARPWLRWLLTLSVWPAAGCRQPAACSPTSCRRTGSSPSRIRRRALDGAQQRRDHPAAVLRGRLAGDSLEPTPELVRAPSLIAGHGHNPARLPARRRGPWAARPRWWPQPSRPCRRS